MFENLELIGTGFAVVMTVLASIWGTCALVGAIFIRATRKATEPVAELAKVPPKPQVASGVPPHHMAAIAAAVEEFLGAGYRVTRVAAPSHQVSEWPTEGRKETFSSRRIRTDWGPTRPTLGGETPNILRGQQK